MKKDFIEYLNRYICEEMSEWITTFTNVYSKKNLRNYHTSIFDTFQFAVWRLTIE